MDVVLGSAPVPLTVVAAGLISLPPAVSVCISEVTWAGMLDKLALVALEDALVLVVSQGGDGGVGPVAVEEPELTPTLDPPSNWAAAPALLTSTVVPDPLMIPALAAYQVFRTERSIVPMTYAAANPQPPAEPGLRAFRMP